MWSDTIAVFRKTQINSRVLQFCRVSIAGIKAVLIWWILRPPSMHFCWPVCLYSLFYALYVVEMVKGSLFNRKVCAGKLGPFLRGKWPGISKNTLEYIYIHANMHICLHFSYELWSHQKLDVYLQPHSRNYQQRLCNSHWTCTLFLLKIL